MTSAAKLDIRTDADTFLRMLGDRHTFQTFDDTKSRRKVLSRVLHGTLAEHGATLASLNARGAGVYVMVNGGDNKGRKTVNVEIVRALFVDLDGAPLEPVTAGPLPPHCIVETSLGRWHSYWLVRNCPLADFKQLQKALAARFNADAKVCDLPRVMRLPGFDHHKREPFRSRIVEFSAAAPYALEEILTAFQFDARPTPATRPRTLPQRIPEGDRNEWLFSLGRGFVQQGIDARGLIRRLQKLNSDRCDPPLSAAEVEGIAANASAYGSDGFATLPHVLLDSPEWKDLPPSAHDIILRAYRRYNGVNNGRIALPYSDFSGLPGFANRAAFYGRRASVLASGVLHRTHEGGLTRNGKEADLFAIAERFLWKAKGRNTTHAQG